MDYNLLILLASLPAIILGFIVYKKDIIEKEPLRLLIKLFFFGVLSSGVALLIELYVGKVVDNVFTNEILNVIVNSFIVIALSEETVKWLFTYILCWNNKDFNYTYDAIVYTVFVSLGFATIENIIALIGNADISLALQRAIITVPAHAFFGIISGYYLGQSKRFQKRKWYKRSKKNLILSLLMPILLHGLFDLLLFMSNKITIIFALIFIVYLYISSYVKLTKASNTSKIIKG